MRIPALILVGTLRGYSAVLFSNSLLAGGAIFVATLFHFKAALTGLAGTLLSNLLAVALGVNEDRIKKGLYGFNGLLVGLSISLYHSLDLNLVILLFAAIVLVIFVTLAVEHLLSHFFGLPALSLPFVIVSIVVYLAMANYQGFQIEKLSEFLYDSDFFDLGNTSLFYFKSLAAIFFQTSPWAGLIIAVTLFIFSRIAFILSIIGFIIGVQFHTLLAGSSVDISSGFVGFNYMLTCIAIGGVFLIPRVSTFLLAALATVVSSLIASFIKIFLSAFNIPVLALPFVTVTLLFIYVARLLHNPRLKVVDFLPGSPEANLDYYKSRLQRFGDSGLHLRLPFSGRWLISQGYGGRHTHREQYKESLDFMAVGSSGTLRRNENNKPSDFYTFGLPVLAPAPGVVTRVVQHLEDNPLTEVETRQNWGNLVVIKLGDNVYCQISHLMKDSITVKEGEFINSGQKLGCAGNSGRSLQPHIHMHFQATPEVGSATIPMTFTQFTSHGQKEQIRFNQVPAENEVVANLKPDFNIKTGYSLPPGKRMKIKWQKENEKLNIETWYARIDFVGNRYLENEKDDRLYFYLGPDYFASLDYNGSKSSGLFLFFLAHFRVPFTGDDTTWSDSISYKHFSSLLTRFFKDLAQPFTDRFWLTWQAEMKNQGSLLVSQVSRGNEKLYTAEASLGSNGIPSLTVKGKKNQQWHLESAS